MTFSGLSALISGRIFDKKRIVNTKYRSNINSTYYTLAFSANQFAELISIILWGIVMGIQETIIHADIPTMIPNPKRGTVYGIFNFAYGLTILRKRINGFII